MLVPVETVKQAEVMRTIRNTCREFMTGDVREISEDEQREWFWHLDRSCIQPYLWLAQLDAEHQALIGYGLIRLQDRKWWVSGGLVPSHRRQGHGRNLFQALARTVNAKPAPCWLRVWNWNEAGLRTYRSLGFIATNEDDNLITMRRSLP